MTRYAVDESRSTIVRTYPTSIGDRASDLTSIDAALEPYAIGLAKALTRLSTALWVAYESPEEDDEHEDVPGHDAGPDRDKYQETLNAVSKPNLPLASGGMNISYDDAEESGHAVGRILHAVGSPTLLAAILDESKAEILAVTAAQAGDLSGRGEQASILSRSVVSAAHVARAHELLTADPMARPSAFIGLEPVACAVAVADWLNWAALLASKASGIRHTAVVMTADNIEPFACERPTLVLERMAKRQSAESIITAMVREALAVANGYNMHLTSLEDLPDVQRPGPDLLEDLLDAMGACFLIWNLDQDDSAPWPDDMTSEEEDAREKELYEKRESAFTAALRTRGRKELRRRTNITAPTANIT
ncbi:hypothetical protein ACTU6U_15230 [Microbacterium sp. A196]|uniref:hypothetical protein n=1 Tax=unclassified Microbacterium TaxID=2609290 RepID=UPI003F41E990